MSSRQFVIMSLAAGACVTFVLLGLASQNRPPLTAQSITLQGSSAKTLATIQSEETLLKDSVSTSSISASHPVASTGDTNSGSERTRFSRRSVNSSHGKPSSETAASRLATRTSRVFAPSADEVDISVPEGVRLPAALLQQGGEESTLNKAQEILAARLAMDFAHEAGANDQASQRNHGAPKAGVDVNAEAFSRWRNAAARSDGRFQLLFGNDAYNRESVRPENLTDQTH